MSAPPLPHPRQFRRAILAVALVASATWWGLGMPYSFFAWLLDEEQARWVLFCYAWEVPFVACFVALVPPVRWLGKVERDWDRVLGSGGSGDPDAVAGLERTVLDYPIRVAGVLLVGSLAGYLAGAIQLRVFAALPWTECVKVMALGLVTGLVGALFVFLYLESRLEPLLRRLGALRPQAPRAGRTIPLSQKVFAGGLVLVITTTLLLGTIAYSRAERTLEEEVGRRVLSETRVLAGELTAAGSEHRADAAWWRDAATRMQLGPHGVALLVQRDGAVAAGSQAIGRLAALGVRPALLHAIEAGGASYAIDRVETPRIVAWATVGDGNLRVVSVVRRADFEEELGRLLARGGAVLLLSLALALLQGFLLSRRLTRPVAVLTRLASSIARRPSGPWEVVPIRTNDEVGELAVAFNRMTARLEEARGELEQHSAELERRVAQATRDIATLYDLARTTSSTLEIAAVLPLVADKVRVTLGLRRLCVLWYPPELDDVVDAYVIVSGIPGTSLPLDAPPDLAGLCPPGRKPAVLPAPPAATPAAVTAELGGGSTVVLPLLYKDQLLGVVLAAVERPLAARDLELAEAIASQAAAALANASLFETARRHETELRKLSQMRVQVQEETLRRLSRDLHDGVGQILTAIKLDIALLERSDVEDVTALRARLRGVREQVIELVQEVRTMSQLLRPSMLDDFGLVPTLQFLTERFASRTDLAVELRTPPPETRLPPALEVLLYRVTQEALTNVANHAQARHVLVQLDVGPREVTLVVADDGVGFDVERFRRAPQLGGLGLLGMRERVAHYRGRIDIRSRSREGVRITLTIPLDAVADGEATDAPDGIGLTGSAGVRRQAR
ncbi:MAG: HAMP domain-containing protein [bacterium]|nr:HAMP domain-containing protein [bacterium]